MTTPNFLVVGAGRSGTTGLVEGLRTHPQVFVTLPKEPHYFALHGQIPAFEGPGDDITINRLSVTDKAAYLSLYPDRHSFLALGDGSVSTMYYAERAAEEIRRINPAMRLVVILREPVERAYSSFLYLKARGFEPCENFVDALTDEPRRRAANWHHLWHYTTMSRYADDLEVLREAVGPDNVGVWFYDDLERDYEATVSEVLRFLEVPFVEGEATGVPRVNVSGQPRVERLQKMIAWTTGNARLRSAVKRATSFRFRERIRVMMLERSPVPKAARQAIDGLFPDDLRRVSTMVGERVPWWLEKHRTLPPSETVPGTPAT